MDFLLDTPIWLWAFLEKDRIRKKVAGVLEDPRNRLWLSPVSVWEALVLFQKGRIKLPGEPVAWVRNALAKGFVHEAGLSHEIALQSRMLDLPQEDPADRFIAATAMVRGFTLITSDAHLLECSSIRTLANR
jgi:PIN domain nuclease of toxin-antitoxin system